MELKYQMKGNESLTGKCHINLMNQKGGKYHWILNELYKNKYQ